MTVLNIGKRISAEDDYVVSDIEIDRDKFVIKDKHLFFFTEKDNPFSVNNEGHLVYESDGDNICNIDSKGHLIIQYLNQSRFKLNIIKKNFYTNDVEETSLEIDNGFDDNEIMVTNVGLTLTGEKFVINNNGHLIFSSIGENSFSINNEGHLIYASDGENPYSIENDHLFTTNHVDGTILGVTKKNMTTKEVSEEFIPISEEEGGEGLSALVYFNELINLFENGE